MATEAQKLLRPMLADNDTIITQENCLELEYPLYLSPKIDGWRAFRPDEVVRTRKGLPIPNTDVRELLSAPEFIGLDGELIAGSPTHPNAMQNAQSAFSRKEGQPDFTWFVFDDCLRTGSYEQCYREKLSVLQSHSPFNGSLPPFIKVVPQVLVRTPAMLMEFVGDFLLAGYEGGILRRPDSPYKRGRTTFREAYLLKVKQYVTSEANLVRMVEKTTNTNPAVKDEQGRTKRSSAKAGMVPAGTLGSFEVRDPGTGEMFSIGAGHLDDAQKKFFFDHRDEYEGAIVTYKHFAQTGVRDKPRHGQFVAFRSPADMS